jgi:hypothetical protein
MTRVGNTVIDSRVPQPKSQHTRTSRTHYIKTNDIYVCIMYVVSKLHLNVVFARSSVKVCFKLFVLFNYP